MSRTNHNDFLPVSGMSRKNESSWVDFLATNRLLLVFCLLFLAGVLLGVMVYAVSRSALDSELGLILSGNSVTKTINDGISSLFSSSFSAIVLLALLFLVGLSACGVPFAVVVPLFFGMGIGLSEAYYYSTGIAGLAVVALLVAPHYLVAAIALILGSMESIRMSLLFSRQLLPSGLMGGLWGDFKLYCARFLVFLGLAFASGILDVIMRLLFSRYF